MGWRGGTGRWVLAALLVCAALLVSASSALAVETGKISGTVTEAGSEKALQGIEANVYEAEGKEFEVGFALTDEKGEYTVEGLPAGKYKVEFFPGFESTQNFVRQFYKGQPTFASAKVVEVVIGEPALSEKIDAAMEVGGKIEGTVTDATTHKALPNAFVVAVGVGEMGGIAFTNSNGQYTILGLATGSYKVEFFAPGYVSQYYNNQPSLALANPVEVIQGHTALGVSAALLRKAPFNTAAPVASGTPAVGQTLSCTTGSWTGSPAPTFTYSWLRDGVPITGATASTYVVQVADQGNGLTCKVTGTNKSGSAAAVSNTLIVPVPPPPPPTPVINLLGGKVVVVSGNAARVPIACASATCAGTIELTGRVVVKRRHHRRIVKTIVLARGPYALAAGRSATIAVRLTSAGKSALAKAKHHRLSARVSVSVIGGATAIGALVLSEPAPRHRHRHR
jgi:hypothetical protein